MEWKRGLKPEMLPYLFLLILKILPLIHLYVGPAALPLVLQIICYMREIFAEWSTKLNNSVIMELIEPFFFHASVFHDSLWALNKSFSSHSDLLDVAFQVCVWTQPVLFSLGLASQTDFCKACINTKSLQSTESLFNFSSNKQLSWSYLEKRDCTHLVFFRKTVWSVSIQLASVVSYLMFYSKSILGSIS